MYSIISSCDYCLLFGNHTDLQQNAAEEDQISADIDWASVTMSTPDPVKVPRSDSQSGSGSGSACGAGDIRGLAVEEEDRSSADTEWTPIGLNFSQNTSQSRSKNPALFVNLGSLHNGFER